MRLLNRNEIIRYYDGFGAWQDTQGWYEDAPVREMVAHMDFGAARFLVELGCGTGRLARDILNDHAMPGARYLGIDISPVMAGLAQDRLRDFPGASVVLGDVCAPLPVPDGAADRVFAIYVFDILSGKAISRILGEAARVLEPGGLLGAVSLTQGETRVSRLASRLWSWVHRMRPQLVGGCRPIDLLAYVPADFEPVHARKVVAWGIASEAVVLRKVAMQAGPR